MSQKVTSLKKHQKSLFVCDSWQQVVMSLAYLASINSSAPHDFLVLADIQGSGTNQEFIEIRSVINLFGHVQVDWIQAESNNYGELHLVPGYALFSDDKKRIQPIKHKKLIVHSDGLRNGLYVDHSLARDVIGIVHYGFRLIERAMLSTKIPKGRLENSHVVPFESISRIWRKIKRQIGDSRQLLLTTSEDLLICERYWGAAYYEILDRIDQESYFDSVLNLDEGRYKRIIFRPTGVYGPGPQRWGEDLRRYARKRKIDFLTWSQFFSDEETAKILDHPEARFFLGNFATLGGIFAFDGSLSVLFACLGESTRVHWADNGNSENIFLDHRMSNLLLEQGEWMRSISNLSANRDWSNSFGEHETDGSIYKSIITELYLDHSRLVASNLLSQSAEKDAQLAEKDAQLAEKDAQLAEKGAQLADLQTSISWQITRPLRSLKKALSILIKL